MRNIVLLDLVNIDNEPNTIARESGQTTIVIMLCVIIVLIIGCFSIWAFSKASKNSKNKKDRN